MRRILHAWGVPLAVAIGAVLANGLLPSLAISLYALAVPDPSRISAFATAVAEPLALLGSTVVTVGGVVWSRPAVHSARRWGALLGVAGALGVVIGSAQAGDLDGWTAATVVLLPATAVVVAATRAAQRRDTHAIPPLPSRDHAGRLAAPATQKFGDASRSTAREADRTR